MSEDCSEVKSSARLRLTCAPSRSKLLALGERQRLRRQHRVRAAGGQPGAQRRGHQHPSPVSPPPPPEAGGKEPAAQILRVPPQVWRWRSRDRRPGRGVQTRQQAEHPGVVLTRHRRQQQDRKLGVQRGRAAQRLLPSQRVLCVQAQLLRHPGGLEPADRCP